MSRYANFACIDCKVQLWLGKVVFREDDSIAYFHIGGSKQPPNSQRPELNGTIWKMLADHAGHHLRVVVEDNPDAVLLDDDDFISGMNPCKQIGIHSTCEIACYAGRELSLKGWQEASILRLKRIHNRAL